MKPTKPTGSLLRRCAPVWLVLVCAAAASAADQAGLDPTPPSPAATQSVKELQEEFLKLKFGMFIHFNLETFKGVQWVAGYHSPADFNPGGKVDTDAWADAAVSAGMKYAVLTAKHVSGFCLWDSKYTAYDVMNPQCPYQQDLVAQFIKSCKSRGLKVGLYYCWRHPGFKGEFKVLPPECDPATHSLEEQIAFQKKQIAELIEKYPDVFYLWNDALDPKIMPADEAQAFIRGLRVDRVPIVVYDPRAPRESRGLVNRDLILNVDLGPTLMDLAGVPIPSQAQGRSLKPLLSRGTPAWRSEIFCAELWDHPEIPRSECVRTERWKYIQYPRHPEYVELFALAADPDEKMNLAEDPGHARVLAKLREHCSRTIKELLDDQTRTKDPETRESVPTKAA